MKYYLMVLCTCLSLLLGTGEVYAQDYNLNQTGTVTITPRYKDKDVVGGNMLVYQIAKRDEQKEKDNYIINKDFSKVEINLDRESIEKNSRIYAKYLLKSTKTANTYKSIENIQRNGVKFEGLEQGVYLFVQTRPADGYELMSPFLLIVPDNGNFSVSAIEKMSPKVGRDGKRDTVVPDKKDNKKDLNKDSTKMQDRKGSSDNNLPQTGQIWWHVYLLAFVGLTLVIISFVRVRKNNE